MERGALHIVDRDACARRELAEAMLAIGLDVNEYSAGRELMCSLSPGACGCVLLETDLPQRSGLQVQDWLAAHHPELRVIFLTGHGDVATAVQAMRQGAFDFIEKPCKLDFLVERVRSAMHESAKGWRPPSALEESGIAALTRREREVLRHLVLGLRNKRIAAELGISERTVESHRAKLMTKMGVSSVATLVTSTLAADPELLQLRSSQ